MNINYHNAKKAAPLPGKALYILTIAISLGLLSACTPKVIKTDTAKLPAKDILVLSGKGFVPSSSESPTYENTLLNVARIFSTALNKSLKRTGANSTLYLSDAYHADNTSVLTSQIAKKHEDAFIEVIMHHVRNSKENTIYLEAEFYPLEYQHLSNGHSRIIPKDGPIKKYPMLSTTQKDLRDADISSLANEFVKELKSKAYIK